VSRLFDRGNRHAQFLLVHMSLPAPVSVALSPNAALLCAISQSTTTISKLTIHTIPRKYQIDNSGTESISTLSFSFQVS